MSDIIETATASRRRTPSSHIIETAELPTWVLYLFHNRKRAQICCSFGGSSRTRDIPGRLARLIVLLQQAFVEDKGLPGNLRGFRHAGQLAKAYDENPAVQPPLDSTVTTYLYKLCQEIQSPAPPGESFPPLILRVKNIGARLLYPVEIRVMGRPPGDAPKPGAGPA